MKDWQVLIIVIGLFALAEAIIHSQYEETTRAAPGEIEIHRYYNEGSQVECFYHQNAISCLWVMDGGK